jgi:hypothetical protein
LCRRLPLKYVSAYYCLPVFVCAFARLCQRHFKIKFPENQAHISVNDFPEAVKQKNRRSKANLAPACNKRPKSIFIQAAVNASALAKATLSQFSQIAATPNHPDFWCPKRSLPIHAVCTEGLFCPEDRAYSQRLRQRISPDARILVWLLYISIQGFQIEGGLSLSANRAFGGTGFVRKTAKIARQRFFR